MNPIKDTTQIKANEARNLFRKGNIFEPSIEELTEYVQALLSSTYKNGEDKEYANTLKDVISIKRTEDLHKETLSLNKNLNKRTLKFTERLHKRTSTLTKIVICVTIVNVIIGAVNVYALLAHNKNKNHEQVQTDSIPPKIKSVENKQ